MSDTKHPAEVLADKMRSQALWAEMTSADGGEDAQECSNMLRTIPALEAERDDLQHEVDGLTQTVIRQGDILRDVVIAVRGKPPENTGWSSHDAAELVRGLAAECARLRAALDDAQAAESVAQMAAEALRADADRYRWLRTQIERQRFVIAESCAWDGLKSWSGDSPDKHIDAAREAQR